MSKLIDRLNQSAQASPQAIGFRKTLPTTPKPKIALIAALAQTKNMDNLADYVTGADALLLPAIKSAQEVKTSKRAVMPVSGIPWGVWLEDSSQRVVTSLIEAGCDFIVLSTATALTLSHDDDGAGKILHVESSLGEGLLRAVNDLPIDAAFLSGEPGKEASLTWHHLMRFRHFAGLLTKALIVSVPLNVTAPELQAVWETGVKGVVVEAGTEPSAGKVAELRQIIDKLTFPQRKREKAEALLPHIGTETSAITEEEEEE